VNNNAEKYLQNKRLDAPRSVNFMYQPPPVPEPRQRPEGTYFAYARARTETSYIAQMPFPMSPR